MRGPARTHVCGAYGCSCIVLHRFAPVSVTRCDRNNRVWRAPTIRQTLYAGRSKVLCGEGAGSAAGCTKPRILLHFSIFELRARFKHLGPRGKPARRRRRGQVAEWSNVPDSKSGVRASVPWVRIPPCPPPNLQKPLNFKGFFYFWVLEPRDYLAQYHFQRAALAVEPASISPSCLLDAQGGSPF